MTDKKNTKKSMTDSKNTKRRLKKQDPPSDVDSESESEYVDTSDSSYVPPTRRRKQNKKENKKEKKEEKLDNKEYNKLLSTLFPSKFMKQKIKEIEEEDEEENIITFKDKVDHIKNITGSTRNQAARALENNKENIKKAIKEVKKKLAEEESEDSDISLSEYEDEDEEEEDDDEEDEDEEEEDDDEEDEDEEEEDDDEEEEYEEDDEENGKTLNILLDLGGDFEQQDDEYFEDDNEQCDSEDEETFMKEKYEKVDDNVIENKKKLKNKKRKEKQRLKEKEEEEDRYKVEQKYLEFVETKKLLLKQIKTQPKSKVLKRAIEDCDKSIKKLIKKSRTKNAKLYHKLITSSKKRTNEVDYFKKKLSNKEQLQIMNDLESINKHINVDKPYRLALLDSDMPSKFKAIAMQRLNVLRSMDQTDPEYYKIKNWVDTFMKIPFGIYKSLSISMKDGIDVSHEFITNAKKTLDNCVYGLDDAKMQIMQLAGQWITNPSALGTAIAIKGPMGTGKTTLVKEGISKILGREFAFIALGGTGDSSFLEGHSYTYEGSTWGKIVQILIDSKCMNPVIFFDELDKLSDTPKGEEINGILTHLTDTSQNSQFHDKYFSEVEFDISKCLFIFSYNDESKVNPILRDRMYRIQTKGYDSKEKLIIARKHLLPKIREQVNFSEEDIIIPDETIKYIASSQELTKNESGVRNLKRCLEIIHTKLNLFRLVKKDEDEMFKKELDLDVSFPFTVSIEVVNKLIKKDSQENVSLSMLYL